MAVSEIETRFLWLNLCFRGRLGQRNTGRQENMHACYRIQHGDVETGSTYNSGCKQDSDAIPAATPRFSRTPQKSGALTDTEICTGGTKFSMATSKPEVVTTQATSKIETRFRRLRLGFRGPPDEWNIDRHRNVHARYRI